MVVLKHPTKEVSRLHGKYRRALTLNNEAMRKETFFQEPTRHEALVSGNSRHKSSNKDRLIKVKQWYNVTVGSSEGRFKYNLNLGRAPDKFSI